MNLHVFRRKRGFEEERQPRRRRTGIASGNLPDTVAPTGVEVTRVREPQSEWPWWLSPTTESARTDGALDDAATIGRPSAEHDETDEETSLTAA